MPNDHNSAIEMAAKLIEANEFDSNVRLNPKRHKNVSDWFREQQASAIRALKCPESQSPTEPSATEAALRSALEQIKTVCLDNSAQTAQHDLALKFVCEVAVKALSASPTPQKPEPSAAMVAAGINACDGQLHSTTIRKVYAAMEASALTRSPSVERGWHPIETAPKDGTRILVSRVGEDVGPNEIEITEWCEHFPLYDYEEVADGLYKEVQTNPDHEGFWNGNGHRATHWMPLPTAPAASPQPQEGK